MSAHLLLLLPINEDLVVCHIIQVTLECKPNRKQCESLAERKVMNSTLCAGNIDVQIALDKILFLDTFPSQIYINDD